MSSILELKPDELAILASLIAASVTRELSLDEQNVLGNFIVAVGSNILVIAARGAAENVSHKM